MSEDLKEEIERFSMREYAAEHFKTRKKWGIFGRRAVKISEIKMGFALKLSKPLTVISKHLYKDALSMFQSIYQYMEKPFGSEAARGAALLTLIRTYDQLRYSKNGLVEELFCQLIQQTTDNPQPSSVERGWEVMAVFVLSGLLPQVELMNVCIGHAESFRFTSSATGAFAVIVHSALCGHVQALKDPGVTFSARFPPLSDLSYEKDIIPLRTEYIAEKMFGTHVQGVIYREMFLKKQDCLLPLRSALDHAVPEVMSHLAMLPVIFIMLTLWLLLLLLLRPPLLTYLFTNFM